MPQINGIDHIHVNVSDRAKSEQWYARVLLLTREKELEFWAVDGGPLIINDKDKTLHLALFESNKIQDTIIALNTSATGLRQWIEHLKKEGVATKPIDHDVSWSVYFKDPDGNPFEITTYEYDQFISTANT